ncbi:MAG: substrate-binding domain-containing protein [Elusimicrobia bacterium]|nr:substrate-binding domain-containing protein [Elusimicrobiota bacterium]
MKNTEQVRNKTQNRRGSRKWWVLTLLFTVFIGCAPKLPILKMATTTSVENSGLMDFLLPVFEKKYGSKIQIIAVGSGKALKLAENGDVDIVLVHDPLAEENFVKKGFGIDRKPVFYNDFIIVGPEKNAAKIRNLKKVVDMFKRIVEEKLIFISRGDNSGTHIKELEIWNRCNVSPKGQWYVETGQGMGETLIIANEKNGYCLTDRATFISYEDKIDLGVLFEGDKILNNPYSVIIVNPNLHKQIKYNEAKQFVGWLSSKEAKELINKFKIKNKQLFQSIGI